MVQSTSILPVLPLLVTVFPVLRSSNFLSFGTLFLFSSSTPISANTQGHTLSVAINLFNFLNDISYAIPLTILERSGTAVTDAQRWSCSLFKP